LEIPYWWDGTPSSLKATIKKYRPDLIEEEIDSNPIPEELPMQLVRHNFSM